MKLFAVACLFLVGVQLTSAQCQDEATDTAPYEVIKITDGYEERLYPATKWVCYNTTSKEEMKEVSFLAIYGYISGANELKEIIPMVTPFGVEMRMASNDTLIFNTCFYLPEEKQSSPPSPTNPKVYIQDRPEITIFARMFGGFALTDIVWTKEFELLAALLKAAGEPNVDFKHFFSSTYDSQFKIKNRRNEVWYPKKEN